MIARVIPVQGTVSEVIPEAMARKLKVAAYCRVSTDFEEQESSYEVQVSHYTDFITGNSAWEFAGIYADDGISATSMKKRDSFNRMIEDALDGKIDRILTKSISRFSRNTVDCLVTVRKLKQKGISVYFEKEDIDTKTEEGEFILTIRASLAQQESESISKNTKLGVNYRFQRGQIMVNHKRFLGYTREEKNGPLVIVPEEAKIVRRIYREYLEGKTARMIAAELESEGVLNGAGSTHWWDTNIFQILSNEKYIGDALLQKTVTIDTLEKVRRKNRNNEPQYYVTGSHPAIISKAIFTTVQNEMRARANHHDANGKPSKYNAKIALSGLCVCGGCGGILRRTMQIAGPGETYVQWRCKQRTTHGRKDGIIRDVTLKKAVMQAISEEYMDSMALADALRNDLYLVLGGVSDDVMAIDAEINRLQELVLKKVVAGEDSTELECEIDALHSRRNAVQADTPMKSGFEERMEAIMENIGTDAELCWDEMIVRKLIQKVTVMEKEIVVEFKNGRERTVAV